MYYYYYYYYYYYIMLYCYAVQYLLFKVIIISIGILFNYLLI